jgi:cyclic dehypoxanthinyl futalosine synthase
MKALNWTVNSGNSDVNSDYLWAGLGNKFNHILTPRGAFRRISSQEALLLWEEAPLGFLMAAAHQRRMELHPHHEVGWIIDRNVNITNVCTSMCTFCNFCRPPAHHEAYVLEMDDYDRRITELFNQGGEQLLLQGGMHPDLGIGYYEELFSTLKKRYPRLKLHALGPPEIAHLSRMENCSYEETLIRLCKAGLDSLPGAGAEILSDRVRRIISPAKCTVSEWIGVMRQAHRLGMVSSATMMFGHIETPEERIEHMIMLRKLQDEKPEGVPGFLSFIPWPFQDQHTRLKEKMGIRQKITASQYIRLIALARLVLDNIPHIQASWLTVGKETAQICLHAGADDFGSVMMEEKVVSTAGATHRMDPEDIQQAIREAGFIPRKRNQAFESCGDDLHNSML